MDVVANEIKQLGGALAVHSQPGQGTTFVLRLPFTLAVTQAILVRSGESTFAIPMTSVQGVARISPEDMLARLSESDPNFSYGNDDYSVHDLPQLLGLPPVTVLEEGQQPLLLTRSGDLRAAIRIDEVLGSREIVVKPVGPQVSSVPGILGATIMPHAIYAHSSLARDRFGSAPRISAIPRLLKATRWDVSLAMLIAGSVNVAMLLLAAANLSGVAGTDSLEGAHAAIGAALGPVIATLFAVGLLASGLASTAVGAYAGAEIMDGLLHRRISILARRLITLTPALAILAAGVDPTFALILSQVALSFGIPFALIPLVNLTARRSVMGEHANKWITTAAGILVSALLIALNVVLIVLTIQG
jgi:hypothetical protein